MEWKNQFDSKCVTVDSENNRVTELSFKEMGSIRGLSDALGELKALKELDLRGCSMHPRLAPTSGRVATLKKTSPQPCRSTTSG